VSPLHVGCGASVTGLGHGDAGKPSVTGASGSRPDCLANRRGLQPHRDRDRAVVDERHLHVGPEAASGHVGVQAAGLPIPDVLVTPETITQGKPNPEGYLTAASQLGVAPSQTVVFEDADAGITAGIAAGAQVVVVGSATRHDDRMQAHPHIPDFRGVTVDALGDSTFTVATP